MQLQQGTFISQPLNSVGIHCILDLYQCSSLLLNDREFVQQALYEAAKQAESTLLGDIVHQFHPQGVTALALLAESHISIHTWPETGYAAIDVYTCGQHTFPERACQSLIQAFQARHYALRQIHRQQTLSEEACIYSVE